MITPEKEKELIKLYKDKKIEEIIETLLEEYSEIMQEEMKTGEILTLHERDIYEIIYEDLQCIYKTDKEFKKTIDKAGKKLMMEPDEIIVFLTEIASDDFRGYDIYADMETYIKDIL